MSWADMVQAEQCGAPVNEFSKPDAFPALSTVVAKDRAVFTKRMMTGSALIKTSTKTATNGVHPQKKSEETWYAAVNSKSAMAAGDDRIKDLEGQVANQDERIQKLESALAHTNDYVRELAAQVNESDRRSRQLEQDLDVNRTRVADLERQAQELKAAAQSSTPAVAPPEAPAVDIPVDSVEPVATVENAACAHGVRLEKSSGESSSEASTGKLTCDSGVGLSKDSAKSITEAKSAAEQKYSTGEKPATAKPAVEDPVTEKSATEEPAIEKNPIEKQPIEEQPNAGPAEHYGAVLSQGAAKTAAAGFVDGPAVEPNANSQETDTASSTAATAPASNSSSLTAAVDQTLPSLPKAKVVPAVAPAPKLSFPIKNGGKINKDKTTTNWATKAALNIGPTSLTAGIPTKDIRDMALTERNELFRGPAITVMVGKEHVRGIPKHMFMAVSPKIRQYFEKNPTESYIAFPVGSISIPVLETLKDYFRHMGSHKNVYSIKLRQDIRQDLSMRHDCVFLGMHKYVAHFTRLYCDKVRQGFLKLDEIALIERYTEDDDALFECLVNNLASKRLRERLPDADKFDAFLEKHPRLGQAIGRIEARLNNNRRGENDMEKENNNGTAIGARSQSRSCTAANGVRFPPRVTMPANGPRSQAKVPAAGPSELPANPSATFTKQEMKLAAKNEPLKNEAHSKSPPADASADKSSHPERDQKLVVPAKTQRGNNIAEHEAKAAPKSVRVSSVKGG